MNANRNPLQDALRLHQAGRVGEALRIYEALLPGNRNNGQLLYLIGSACLQMGRFEASVEHLGRSIALAPGDSAAHNNLGNALLQLGRPEDAVASYDRAIVLEPGYAEAHNNRGIALNHLRRPQEALASYDRAIALRPDYAEAYNNRGIVLNDLGRPQDALASCDRAIALRPRYAEAYFNRGNVLNSLKRPDEALAGYDRAIALRPDYAEAYANRGNVLRQLDRPDEALASYDRAIALNPAHTGVYGSRGNTLRQLGRPEEALASYDKAIALDDGHAELFSNRGNALNELGRFEEALASYDKAIALRPDYAEAYYNRGNALKDLGRAEEAIASYDRAIALRPDYAEAWDNRGNALAQLRRADEALASYDRAIALRPDDAEAYWNKSLLLIARGDYAEGWRLYDWRLRRDINRKNYDAFPQPAWRGGEDVRDRTLLVYGEQGYGDVIQFCRYLPDVQSLGARIIFEVRAPLVALVKTLGCPMTVVEKGAPLPAFDLHCPVMSLPFAFGTTVPTIPNTVPYLHADRDRVDRWRRDLGDGVRPRVGLAWSGSPLHQNDANRSLPLDALAPLLSLPVDFHSLQVDYRQGDLAFLNRHPEIRQHQDALGDFADTAALIEAMDLVLTVDTAVAHIAGALGKTVWIMLPHVPDYRWMWDRADTPWYPTARLFRQPAAGDWHSVVAAVGHALIGAFTDS